MKARSDEENRETGRELITAIAQGLGRANLPIHKLYGACDPDALQLLIGRLINGEIELEDALREHRKILDADMRKRMAAQEAEGR